MKSIFVAVPCYDHRLYFKTARSIFEGVALAAKAGYHCQVVDFCGNCYIHQTRSILACEFLDSLCDDLFFIDTDMVFTAEDFLRMLPYEEAVVAANYPNKTDSLQPTVIYKEGETPRADGLLEVQYAPTGFMKIHRGVIQHLYDGIPSNRTARTTKNGRLVSMIFDTGFFTQHQEMNDWFGEDYYFCHLWRQLGGKIFIDPSFKLGHIGNKEYREP